MSMVTLELVGEGAAGWGGAGTLVVGAPGVPTGGGGGGSAPGGGGGSAGGGGDGGSGTLSNEGGGEGAGPGPGGGANPFQFMLPILLGLFLVMIVMQIFAGRKQKKEREAMLGGLKKQDVVQTSGGMIGTVVELKDDEVVLKIDSETNTRARFAKGSVQQVVRSH